MGHSRSRCSKNADDDRYNTGCVNSLEGACINRHRHDDRAINCFSDLGGRHASCIGLDPRGHNSGVFLCTCAVRTGVHLSFYFVLSADPGNWRAFLSSNMRLIRDSNVFLYLSGSSSWRRRVAGWFVFHSRCAHVLRHTALVMCVGVAVAVAGVYWFLPQLVVFGWRVPRQDGVGRAFSPPQFRFGTTSPVA